MMDKGPGGRWFPTTIDGERRAGAALTYAFPEGRAPSFDTPAPSSSGPQCTPNT